MNPVNDSGNPEVALGCRHSIRLAVEVKREIGAIWADTDAPPYTDIFNDRLSASEVWKSVIVMREVEKHLQFHKRSTRPKADMIATHMNRVILHMVFRDSEVQKYVSDPEEMGGCPAEVKALTADAFGKVVDYIDSNYTSVYIGSIAKNRQKCEALVDDIARGMSPGSANGQPTLPFS